MKLPVRINSRHLAAHLAVAVTVATATVAGVAFADGASTSTTRTDSTAATFAASRNPAVPPAAAALDRLVTQGVINSSQADRIEQQVIAGAIDPSALIHAGVVNASQMQAVATVIDQVKASLGR